MRAKKGVWKDLNVKLIILFCLHIYVNKDQTHNLNSSERFKLCLILCGLKTVSPLLFSSK